MKKCVPYILMAMLLLGQSSCKEKKQSQDIVLANYVPDTPQPPIRLSVDHRQTTVEWLGRNYTVDIQREPADSLPMLTDESGQQYIDNRVTLVVKRADNTEFVKKTFFKNSFSHYLDNDMLSRGFLENIVFHGVKNGVLFFAVVVSHPGTDDEFVPLEMSIDRQGGLSIKQGEDELFDMAGNAE